MSTPHSIDIVDPDLEDVLPSREDRISDEFRPFTAVKITYQTIQMASAEDPPTPSICEEYDSLTSPIWSAALDPCTDAMNIVLASN